MQNWLLPEYIEDILPAEAAVIESLRARLLECFRVHGYALVHPPLVEYVESLATGTGRDMDLQTFKLIDRLSGRLMGLRADISPQVARIDAHALNRQGVARLCYAGRVVHTTPDGLGRSRELFQIGAELFGHAGIESDLEIQRLLLTALKLAGVSSVHVDLGHVAILRGLVRLGACAPALESELFDALQAKDIPTLEILTSSLAPAVRSALLALPTLYGDREVLDRAREVLPPVPEIAHALDELAQLADALRSSSCTVCIDLAESRGYHYHSGAVFSAYVSDWRKTLARGGRYDEIGKAFGRARPATGFSIDLRELAGLLAMSQPAAAECAVLAPLDSDPALAQKIDALRAAGTVVITDLPGHQASRDELGCDRMLVKRDGVWKIEPLVAEKVS